MSSADWGFGQGKDRDVDKTFSNGLQTIFLSFQKDVFYVQSSWEGWVRGGVQPLQPQDLLLKSKALDRL